jgi:hypothetical protein
MSERAGEEAQEIEEGTRAAGPHSFVAVSVGGVELDDARAEIQCLRIQNAILSGVILGLIIAAVVAADRG